MLPPIHLIKLNSLLKLLPLTNPIQKITAVHKDESGFICLLSESLQRKFLLPTLAQTLESVGL